MRSIAAQLAPEDRIFFIALVVAAVSAWAIWRLAVARRSSAAAASAAGTVPCRACAGRWPCPPGPSPDPAPAQAAGPMPSVGEVDATDFVARALAHVPCDRWPWPGCEHERNYIDPADPGAYLVADHCRACGLPYPCPDSGPLNQRSNFDEDVAAYRRSWRETGRWDR